MTGWGTLFPTRSTPSSARSINDFLTVTSMRVTLTLHQHSPPSSPPPQTGTCRVPQNSRRLPHHAELNRVSERHDHVDANEKRRRSLAKPTLRRKGKITSAFLRDNRLKS